MAWAAWLCVPIAATLLAALWTWLQARRPRPRSTGETIEAHRAYLAALAGAPDSSPATPVQQLGLIEPG